MTAATLWIEMTIAGSIYVASLFFVVLGLSWHPGINLESLANQFQPYKTYVGVALVALSYIFGFIAHRIIQILFDYGTIVMEKVADHGKNDADKPPDHQKSPKQRREQTLKEEMKIWASCSQRVHREMDFQFAQAALLRSLLFSSLFLAASVGCWLKPTYQDHLIADILCFLFFYMFLVFAFVRQDSQYKMIRGDALRVAEAHPGCSMPILSSASAARGTSVMIEGVNVGKTTFDVEGVATMIRQPARIEVRVPEGATSVKIVVPGSKAEE